MGRVNQTFYPETVASEDLTEVGRRTALAESATDRLMSLPGVVRVRPFGSLTTGEADAYSDVDLLVEVEGVSDRLFAEDLPLALESLGRPLIVGWGLNRLPDTYVRTIYLADYPLFWHLDIGCVSTSHEDDDDLVRRYHWPQIFKMWIAEVKQYARGRGDGAAFLRHISRWADGARLSGSSAARLGQALELCAERARARGAPCEEVYHRCTELRSTYL